MSEKELTQDRKDDILERVVSECARSIGFDNVNAGELVEQRQKALEYFKGEMTDLVQELAGRSKVVSMDVADAVETAMPDLIEIFTADDDVISFRPVGEEDVAAAEQEQEYLRHIIFQRNEGWRTIYEAFKDALTCKTGVFSWRWEGEYEPPAEQHINVPVPVLVRCLSEGNVDPDSVTQGDPDPEDGTPTVSFEFRPKYAKGRIVIEAIAPEDLAVGSDTITLATATYCAVRSRPRAQDLISMGFDAEVVEKLPPWNNNTTQPEQAARDTVAETQMLGAGVQAMRQVEIYRHYIRVYDEDEKEWCLYQVITGGKGYTNLLLDIEEVSRIQLAAITPYINPHRFYGDSVADKVIELQKIKSSLMRMALDSGAFALNQRFEVDESKITANTIADLLANDPGRPVRVRSGGAVVPISAGGLNYDPLAYLEFFSTQVEQRTGIVRNAQGLNPDTLHDTAQGAMALLGEAQKRIRLIARSFAETGYKDFLINLHATLRENGASMRDTIQLRGQWVEIDPSTWRQRDDMVIQIGVGAGGRDHDLMVGQQIAAIQEKLAAGQAIPDGPLIDKSNMYNSAVYALRKLGVRAIDRYIKDPAKFDASTAAAPPPDPDMIKAANDKAKADQDFALRQQELDQQFKFQMAQLEQKSRELDLKQEQLDGELSISYAKIKAELDLRKYEIDVQAEIEADKVAVAASKRDSNVGLESRQIDVMRDDIPNGVHVGGEPGQ